MALAIVLAAIGYVTLPISLQRIIWFNYAGPTDYTLFHARQLEAPDSSFRFFNGTADSCCRDLRMPGQGGGDLLTYLEQHGTLAFLLIRGDSIKVEHYFDGHAADAVFPSFSMAKAVLSMLIGCAIADGYILSVNDRVTYYIPELVVNGFSDVRLRHLLQMTSGLDYDEGYRNPFSDVANDYYTPNLRRRVTEYKLGRMPGSRFAYQSGNSQLLGMVLEKALKGKTITGYLQEKLWEPLGMEYDGSWNTDEGHPPIEKAFCCINARARDFAKLGRLYMRKGDWEGNQLVPAHWVEISTANDTTESAVWNYQYQWWKPTKKGDFAAIGHLGQFIYVNPAKQLIVVRLGKASEGVDWRAFFLDLAQHLG